MNWQEDVIKLIVAHFKSVGINYIPSAEVNKCLIDFMNLEMKLVDPKPRYVFKSSSLGWAEKMLTQIEQCVNEDRKDTAVNSQKLELQTKLVLLCYTFFIKMPKIENFN